MRYEGRGAQGVGVKGTSRALLDLEQSCWSSDHTALPSSLPRCTAGVRHSPFVCAFAHSFITVTVDSGGEEGVFKKKAKSLQLQTINKPL